MIDGPIHVLTTVAAVGSAVMAGCFLIFSVMVMPALARLSATQGIAAMQQINIVAIRPVFMTTLFAPALISIVLLIVSIAELGETWAGYVLAGSVTYLIAAIVVTAGYNVPRNNALAELDPADPNAEAHWGQYVREWTRSNHVRALGSLAAAVLFTLALVSR
ncbi:DUF1772 domain-containing protein [Phytoactinopolyspora mesophila]|uniref:DUF1772 domain-containing protein n=1 Tax=Phytoactinopolyspora mesophila TaxID=2650750 RepID=A0A7K3M8D4_9ACTN|nr:anthrone oxygenase family protein [Phytoactinopolyspora mesophila]NDL59534.1 DUF1772 domain-containing protein [Phytoactinopolyspora mesophila]